MGDQSIQAGKAGPAKAPRAACSRHADGRVGRAGSGVGAGGLRARGGVRCDVPSRFLDPSRTGEHHARCAGPPEGAARIRELGPRSTRDAARPSRHGALASDVRADRFHHRAGSPLRLGVGALIQASECFSNPETGDGRVRDGSHGRAARMKPRGWRLGCRRAHPRTVMHPDQPMLVRAATLVLA